MISIMDRDFVKITICLYLEIMAGVMEQYRLWTPFATRSGFRLSPFHVISRELEQDPCVYCSRWYFQQRINTILIFETGASPYFCHNQLVKLRTSSLVIAMLLQK
jgi:hypothetical protein